MSEDHNDRGKIIKDLSEGGFFEESESDEEKELDRNAQIIVITWVRMASNGTFNPKKDGHIFEVSPKSFLTSISLLP